MKDKFSRFKNRGVNLHRFFFEKILEHSKQHNGIGNYPLTQVRAIMSCSFKKDVMNRVIQDLENAGFLRYSKRSARIFLVKREEVRE